MQRPYGGAGPVRRCRTFGVNARALPCSDQTLRLSVVSPKTGGLAENVARARAKLPDCRCSRAAAASGNVRTCACASKPVTGSGGDRRHVCPRDRARPRVRVLDSERNGVRGRRTQQMWQREHPNTPPTRQRQAYPAWGRVTIVPRCFVAGRSTNAAPCAEEINKKQTRTDKRLRCAHRQTLVQARNQPNSAYTRWGGASVTLRQRLES